ncbi:MAG: DUF393 domain-containing protein [Actinomycetia bacterium]|nr:DUF393 domain-containing protein [Actinomycetes bacterium]
MTSATWPVSTEHHRPLLVFDGDCGFCTTSAIFIVRRIRPTAQVVPWQRLNLGDLGLTEQQCTEAVQWVTPDGAIRSGSQAIMAMLATAGAPWRVLGRVGEWPPVAILADRCYRWIAEHRGMLPGATPACAQPITATG